MVYGEVGNDVLDNFGTGRGSGRETTDKTENAILFLKRDAWTSLR